ncbi:protein DA1-related 2-like isoform X2 [Cucurbita maxima]|uniref:Protein DA1-related 2-like isoform X2 n=1 Tax=Cucurbita maxima TaxID=3661 RepID=A0A6J1K1W6_CUCMA|nr:protein DA1-related 2-like isoform X2 [Cucurbita maxima]
MDLSHPCISGIKELQYLGSWVCWDFSSSISFSSSYAKKKSGWMKWLSKIVRPGPNRGGGGSGSGGSPPQQLLGDQENIVWRAPARSTDDSSRAKKEKEELDHAIALSLDEDFKRQNQNDEAISRELQGKMTLSPYPYVAPPQFLPGDYSFPLTEHEISMSGNYPYHRSYFKELTHPKCEVCHQFIPTNRAGLAVHRCSRFWSQKYCLSHELDKTAYCCSCRRLESWNARYISLGDGRSLCLECLESAVMDTGDCQLLYHSIRDYYEGMNMRIDQQIPMFLVERQVLNEAIVEEKHGNRRLPENRGVCLSEVQRITSIVKRPKIEGHRLVGMRTQRQKLIRNSEVIAILVLFGFPRLLTGSILAHELMHSWLRLKGYRNIKREVEEGICEVLSYMWLESEVMSGLRSRPSSSTASSSSSSSSSSHYSSSSKKGGNSSTEKKLGEFFMYQIVNSPSKIYGDGFRAANVAVNKYGLRRTLDHIHMTGSFPI